MRPLALPLLVLPLAAWTTHINGLLPVSPAPGAQVDSLTPTLQWEPFPERGDPHVTEVVYDLRVLESGGAQVYSREGLPECSHRLQQALVPGRVYYWTVRVRFRWDGRRRETQWTTVRNSRGSPSTPEDPARYMPLRSPVATDGK